jgi:hypothetical protein
MAMAIVQIRADRRRYGRDLVGFRTLSEAGPMLATDISESLSAAVGLANLDQHVDRLAAITDEDERLHIVFGWPVLLAPVIRSMLRDHFMQSGRLTDQVLDAFDFLERVASDLHEHRVFYQPGGGPIERLWTAQTTGAISAVDVETVLRSKWMAAAMFDDYVRAMCGWLLAAANESSNPTLDDAHFVQGAQMAQLLAEATAAMRKSPEGWSARDIAHVTLARTTGLALEHRPDARIYRRVLAMGEALVAEADERGDLDFAAELLYELGLMHFPGYIFDRSTVAYSWDVFCWRESMRNHLGSTVATLTQEEWRMPPPEEALSTAARLLRASRESRKRGADQEVVGEYGEEIVHQKEQGLPRTDLRLCEVLKFLTFLGDAAAHAELREIGGDLLQSAALKRDITEWTRLLGDLQHQGRSIAPEELDEIRSATLDERVKALGTVGALYFAHAVAAALQQIDPAYALNLLRAARELLDGESESRRLMHWDFELGMLVRLYDSGGESLDAIRASAAAEGWDVERLAVCLLGFARTDNREESLALLDEIQTLAPTLSRIYRASIGILRARLLLRCAADGAAGVENCLLAASEFLSLDLPREALFALWKTKDLERGADGPISSLERLPDYAFALEQRLGPTATPVIQRVCNAVLAAQGQELTIDGLLAVTQAAKGLRFAVVLDAGLSDNWLDDAAIPWLQNTVRNAEAAVDQASHIGADGQDAPVPEEALLVSFAGVAPPSSADTNDGRLTRAQQAFDNRLSALELSSLGAARPTVLRIDEIRRGLDSQTVLLIIYGGQVALEDRSIEAILYVLFVSRDETFAVAERQNGVPARTVLARASDGHVLGDVTPYAIDVHRCRVNVQEDPGPWPVSPNDPHSMNAGTFLTHSIVDRLTDELRRGRDALCIVPHGAMHFLPFHLCERSGRPLADDWTVTYLPNLHLLTPRGGVRRPLRHRPTHMTAVGIGFEEDPREFLSPIPDAVTEAVGVADVFHTEALIGATATKERVISALETSRFVHISTHGEHSFSSPAFQCIYLAPDPAGNDRLAAHEILSLDLHGLKVLSLSACESGLGRIDDADNLQGLPANALLAGAETLIVALWQVTADCSKLFFSAFYEGLRTGDTRRQAFAAAQRTARDVYPQYRDWGAFALIGDWT